MQKRDSERKSLRIPVYLDIRLDLACGLRVKGKIVDLGTEGLMIETNDPLLVRENFTAEFLLPDTLTSIQVEGDIAWVRLCRETGDEDVCRYRAGIRFVDLKEPFLSLIRDYTLKLLCDEEQVRKQGIDQVLKDIANLPQKERRAAHSILASKGLISNPDVS
jgi:hypothetical protein